LNKTNTPQKLIKNQGDQHQPLLIENMTSCSPLRNKKEESQLNIKGFTIPKTGNVPKGL
jgi:hypothetical protein